MKLMCRENHLNKEQSEILTSSSIIESIAFKGDTLQGKSCQSILEIKALGGLKDAGL